MMPAMLAIALVEGLAKALSVNYWPLVRRGARSAVAAAPVKAVCRGRLCFSAVAATTARRTASAPAVVGTGDDPIRSRPIMDATGECRPARSAAVCRLGGGPALSNAAFLAEANAGGAAGRRGTDRRQPDWERPGLNTLVRLHRWAAARHGRFGIVNPRCTAGRARLRSSQGGTCCKASNSTRSRAP